MSKGSLFLFQFHKGTIRTIPYMPDGVFFRNFNSIKVRLELPDLLLIYLVVSYFNSIKVRLEPFSTVHLISQVDISIP